jgi:hypothetical protein
MQTADNICFLQILRLHDAELWQTKDGVLSLRSKGNLQVLYSKEMNIFGLKLNDFKWSLGKNLQVVGSYCGSEGYYSYNIPTFDGYYTIKIPESQTGPALTNFETFLSNTCQFIRKDNLHQDLQRSNEGKLKGTLHKTLDKITHVFHHQEKETEPNYRLVRSFQDMLVFDGHEAHMVDLPSVEVLNVLQETGEVIKNHQDTEAWIKIRGEFQPTLIEAGENLFVHKEETTSQKWGSNVTNASTRSDRDVSGGSLEGGRLLQSNLGQNPSLSSNVLSSGSFRTNTTNTSTQPFDQTNVIKTDFA